MDSHDCDNDAHERNCPRIRCVHMNPTRQNLSNSPEACDTQKSIVNRSQKATDTAGKDHDQAPDHRSEPDGNCKDKANNACRQQLVGEWVLEHAHVVGESDQAKRLEQHHHNTRDEEIDNVAHIYSLGNTNMNINTDCP